MNYDLYVDGDALAMILNQAFHRTFKYRAQLNTHFLCCFCQNLLVVEGYGADEVHLALPTSSTVSIASRSPTASWQVCLPSWHRTCTSLVYAH